jgi:hypothetical protein
VGLERGPLSLASTTEEPLGRKSSGSALENREYGRRNPSLKSPQKLALTSPTNGCLSVGIVRSRTKAVEFSFSLIYFFCVYFFLHLVTFPLFYCVLLSSFLSNLHCSSFLRYSVSPCLFTTFVLCFVISRVSAWLNST